MAQPEVITSPPLRVVAPKPRMTIYYALLIIAFVAVLMACLFLYLEIRRFGGFGTVQGRVSSVDEPASVFRHREHTVHRETSLQIASASSVCCVANS